MRQPLLACLFVAAGTAAAGAEEQAFSLDRFQPALDDHALGSVPLAEVPTHLTWSLAGWANYAHKPLVRALRGAPAGVVGHRLGMEGGGAIGVLDRVMVGASMPVTAVQLRTDGSEVPIAGSWRALDPVGPGDMRVFGRAALLRERIHLVSVALAAEATLPTSLGLAYRGELRPTFTPSVLVSRRVWGARLAAGLGARLRGDRVVGQQTLGDEWVARAGFGYDVAAHVPEIRLMPFVEGTAWTALGEPLGLGARPGDLQRASVLTRNGAELAVGARWSTALGLQFVGGVSAGVGGLTGVPDFRVFTGVRFVREVLDTDGDGLLDPDDRCPRQAEDKDGYADRDGCPDLDDDDDGVPDTRDRCPLMAEDLDGFQDEDGCRDPDNDLDGIVDPRDACPDQPGPAERQGCPGEGGAGAAEGGAMDRCPAEDEDEDGFQDMDGCPDPDNDGDGIPDASDRCPDAAENRDGVEDADGCPETDGDRDGYPDGADACPAVAATPNGRFADGCPDPETPAVPGGSN